MASLLLSALVTGKTNSWAEFYDPKRVRMSAAGAYVAENVTAVKNSRSMSHPEKSIPSKSSNAVREQSFATVYERSRRFAATTGLSIDSRPSAPILDATCTGMVSSNAGTAPATARISGSTAPHSTDRR